MRRLFLIAWVHFGAAVLTAFFMTGVVTAIVLLDRHIGWLSWFVLVPLGLVMATYETAYEKVKAGR